jgi:hypothetical protein
MSKMFIEVAEQQIPQLQEEQTFYAKPVEVPDIVAEAVKVFNIELDHWYEWLEHITLTGAVAAQEPPAFLKRYYNGGQSNKRTEVSEQAGSVSSEEGAEQ